MSAASAAAAVHHAADRLVAAIHRTGSPICIGLDPVIEKLPQGLRPAGSQPTAAASAIEKFSIEVINVVADVAPCVKVQSACFERYGSAGFAALENTVAAARRAGLQVILDAKRGDIGISAEHYAAAAFDHLGADWLTVNGYLGADAIEPFLKTGRGVIVLVRTSNPGSDVVQSEKLADGRTVSDVVASMVREVGRTRLGVSGYSSVGAVVGATKPADAARLRAAMPESVFLVPGYGAQGAGLGDVLACFNEDGRGALITASRSVIYAFEPRDSRWAERVRDAARAFGREISEGVRARRGSR
jgi:orotidine-5'-phosphate decarboxylase